MLSFPLLKTYSQNLISRLTLSRVILRHSSRLTWDNFRVTFNFMRSRVGKKMTTSHVSLISLRAVTLNILFIVTSRTNYL